MLLNEWVNSCFVFHMLQLPFCFLIYYLNTVFYKETGNSSLLSPRLCWLRFPVLAEVDVRVIAAVV